MVVDSSSSGPKKTVLWAKENWKGDPDGDVTLEFDGYTWKVKKDIVCARFPCIKAALAKATPGSHAVVSARTSLTTRPMLFSALLQFLHTNKLPSQIWEDQPSFFTFVEFYFLAERFGIDHIKVEMVKCVEDLSRHVLSLGEPHCSHCPLSQIDMDWEEKKHLASFLDAVLFVEEQPWSAKIVKAMYDAGDCMKLRLMRLPAFQDFVGRFPVGRSFARAIGVDRL